MYNKNVMNFIQLYYYIKVKASEIIYIQEQKSALSIYVSVLSIHLIESATGG